MSIFTTVHEANKTIKFNLITINKIKNRSNSRGDWGALIRGEV